MSRKATWLQPPSAKRKLANWYLQRFHASILGVLQEHTALQPASVVVEFGSNEGLLANYLSRHCRLILTDLSDCRQTPESQACEFHQCSAEHTPFSTSSVDVIIMISVYHHLRNFEEFTRESARILKPGGRLVLVEPIKRHPTIMLLNLLSSVVHANDVNLQEPYGLGLWIDRAFMIRQLAPSYRLRYEEPVDNFLWGINAVLPLVMLKGYDAFQRAVRWPNTAVHVFQRQPASQVSV